MLESNIGLPSVSCRSLTYAPRSVADCPPTQLQPQCCGIQHEDAESKAIVAGPPILPCRQSWKRPRAVADAASRGDALEQSVCQACSAKQTRRTCKLASLSQSMLVALQRDSKRISTRIFRCRADSRRQEREGRSGCRRRSVALCRLLDSCHGFKAPLKHHAKQHCLTSSNSEPQRNRGSFEECNTHALRIHVACAIMTPLLRRHRQ